LPQAVLDTQSPAMLWLGRALSALVVLFMLFDGAIKLVPLEAVTEASRQLGLPTSAAFSRGLGLVGLTCTALYAFPRTAIFGAILLTAYMGGTVVTHLLAGSPIFTHLMFGVYLALLAWGGLFLRDADLRRMIPLRRA
jgi:hypothetical protein